MTTATEALLDDALAQRIAGGWQAALALSREAYGISWQSGDVLSMIEAVLSDAHTRREMGESDVAADAYELAYTIASLTGATGAASRSLNGLGILLQQRGEMDGAESSYRQAHALASTVGDALTIGNIEMNLGTLHTVRGDLPAARTYYSACLTRYKQISHERGVIGALNNLGMLHIDCGELVEAGRCLRQALSIAKDTNDVINEGTVHINMAELLLAEGNLERARASCDEAYEIFSRCNEQLGRSEALKCYGVIYRETSKLYLAEAHLRDAIHIADQNNYPLQEAEAQRELSLVWRRMGRNRDALGALNRAHSLFAKLQARADQIDIRRRLQRLEEDFLELVSYWGESIDEVDQYTRGHCHRVAAYACKVATEIGFRAQDLVWFRMGALLHDVGKTAMPAELLNKPGGLLPEERDLMEQHTILGENLLSGVEFPWDIRPMIRSHHERWDGAGYPDGLKGDAIPLAARILHVADVFDALTTTRSYRLRLSAHAALEVMKADFGSYDPEVFRIFEVILDREYLEPHRTAV